MSSNPKSIVIVGGGSAGWLTAGLLAAKLAQAAGQPTSITLVEAPDIPIIGVGEGTWPTMRQTLHDIGVDEKDFLRECNVSCKQGSQFRGWSGNSNGDAYYHPFDPPMVEDQEKAIPEWLRSPSDASFSRTMCAQEHLCEGEFAPKRLTSPQYAGLLNYGYHLDAGRFSELVKQHCIDKLGLKFVAATVTHAVSGEDGSIAAIATKEAGLITGDLFVDCTGFRSLLLGDHLGVPTRSMSRYLFADAAVAIQKPYEDGDSVQSTTVATAQEAGWIWDISLSHRRGVGHVFSTAHTDEASVRKNLRKYLQIDEAEMERLNPRRLNFVSGYREEFWKSNCVAVGLSAGFVEPLEASALMLTELSARKIAELLGENSWELAPCEQEFNQQFHRHWDDVVEFLKLHYVLSERKEPFWVDHRRDEAVPDRLLANLGKWKYRFPKADDIGGSDGLFPLASYNYILCGLGFDWPRRQHQSEKDHIGFDHFAQTLVAVENLASRLPGNRAYLDSLIKT